MTAGEIFQAADTEKVPADVAINVGEDEDGMVITAAPLDIFLLFPQGNDDFELIFSEK